MFISKRDAEMLINLYLPGKDVKLKYGKHPLYKTRSNIIQFRNVRDKRMRESYTNLFNIEPKYYYVFMLLHEIGHAYCELNGYLKFDANDYFIDILEYSRNPVAYKLNIQCENYANNFALSKLDEAVNYLKRVKST